MWSLCNCARFTTDNTTVISRCCVNGSMRSSSICLMGVYFCSRCRRWLVPFYISSSGSMPDTLIQQFRFAGCLEVRHSCLDHMPCTVEFVPMPEIRPSLVRLDNGIVRIEVAIRLLCRSDQRNHLIEKAIKR